MPSNLQGLEIIDNSTAYNFEIFKRGDNQQRGVTISTKEWEIGDPIGYWKEPLFPFDGGLRQDRLPRVASITTEHTRSRSYAKANIDASNEGVLVPPPATSPLNFPNNAVALGPPVIFDGLEFFLCGRYMVTVDRTGAIATDKDFGSGNAGVSMAVFNNELIVGMGETVKIWKRDISGTWTQATDSTFAIALGVVGNKLWRAESINKMSNCITAPLTLASYTPASPNQYSAGDSTYAVNTIIDYGGVPVALKDDGAYFPDSKSDFYNQAPQMARWPHIDNGKGAFVAQGYLWVPTIIGLLRISPGESVIRGPEKSNRPDFRFWVRGGVEWGESIYLLVTDETAFSETFICKMSKDRYGLTQGQEYIYHEWCRLGSVDKGFSIGINSWPSSGISSITRDAGTVADFAGIGTVAWGTPSNGISSNNSYATATAGTSRYLRYSNFGFSLASTDTLLGFLVSLERKGSTGTTNVTKSAPASAFNQSGAGSINWTINGSDITATGIPNQNVSTVFMVRTQFGFAIPADATVLGIEVTITTTAEDTGQDNSIVDNIVKLYQGTLPVGVNKSTGAHRDAMDTFGGVPVAITYGSPTDTWGLTLNGNDINNTAFGAAFSVTFQQCSWTITYNSISIKVYYTASGVLDNVVKIVNASGTVVGTNLADTTTSWPNVDTVKEYGGSGNLWGSGLTPANVNDTDFGFVVSATVPSSVTASVDFGNITVIFAPQALGAASPTLFATFGSKVKRIDLGFGSGRDIDDPSYVYNNEWEIETGLVQPIQNVTLVSGLLGVSFVGKVRANDAVHLHYALGADSAYSELLSTQEGGGVHTVTGDGSYQQFTRYAPPNTIGPYFKFYLHGELGSSSGTNRPEIRVMWAFGYVRPKVTDLIKIPIYADRLAMFNGIPQGRSGGDNLRLFRAWKRDQTVLAVRVADYEESRTIRARVFEVEGEELITEKDTDGQSREVIVANVVLMRDDFAGAYGV